MWRGAGAHAHLWHTGSALRCDVIYDLRRSNINNAIERSAPAPRRAGHAGSKLTKHGDRWIHYIIDFLRKLYFYGKNVINYHKNECLCLNINSF